jgi:predicted nucleic acid-binding protein
VVVDPNVFVSAQVSSLGHPARIARAAEEGAFELVISERLLEELRDVRLRPRFGRYMPEDEVKTSSRTCGRWAPWRRWVR